MQKGNQDMSDLREQSMYTTKTNDVLHDSIIHEQPMAEALEGFRTANVALVLHASSHQDMINLLPGS